MNKETIYKKVQDLFPTELGKEFSEGDVVEDETGQQWTIYYIEQKYNRKQKPDLCWYYTFAWINGKFEEDTLLKEDLKLIRKRITLPMVLEAIKKKGKLFYIGHGYMMGESTMLTVESSAARWQLTKNGKDCNLYDQSIELLELVWEILK